MCLATVYGRKQEEESILIRNASRIDVEGTAIRIRDIMGAEVVVEGAITMVDLANSVVKINCSED
ncbi:MAG: CooT family nickel-binding protein [Lachnospiraceae bacterium]|nr:CooT family nickel-binding protein [Lachnospiraceae bacterium]